MIYEKFYKTNILQKYDKFYSFLNDINEQYDYKLLLPNYLHKEYKESLSLFEDRINQLDSNVMFLDNIIKYKKLFSLLQPAKINLALYKIFLNKEKNESLKKSLRSFKPVRFYTQDTDYDLTNNVTGRLVVKNGPSILTLPARYRSILESRFNEGNIISIDFSSLEPRFCLKLLGKDTKEDLYEDFNKKLDLNLDRSIIKRAIISVLYGAHHSSLKEISASKSRLIFESIREFFELDKLLEHSSNIDSFGIRRNYLGRPLWNLEVKKENILINNYIQSSAVDIALNYFHELLGNIDLEKAVPLFVLHDAMIFDLSSDYIEEFINVIKLGYNHEKLGNFPIKSEIFNLKHKEEI